MIVHTPALRDLPRITVIERRHPCWYKKPHSPGRHSEGNQAGGTIGSSGRACHAAYALLLDGDNQSGNALFDDIPRCKL